MIEANPDLFSYKLKKHLGKLLILQIRQSCLLNMSEDNLCYPCYDICLAAHYGIAEQFVKQIDAIARYENSYAPLALTE